MAEDKRRAVTLDRLGFGRYEAVNSRGGRLVLGDGGTEEFTPVEALLAAVAGCAAIDVDYLTTRISEPEQVHLVVAAEKLRDADGNHLGEVEVRFTVRFGDGPEADRARDRLPDAVAKSRDRLCTVSRTVALPTPVRFEID